MYLAARFSRELKKKPKEIRAALIISRSMNTKANEFLVNSVRLKAIPLVHRSNACRLASPTAETE